VIGVEIKNFQAIDHLKLEIEGFTALVGRTNIGKSSVVRALKTALSGGSGSNFVRHDARTCARILTNAKSCKCCSSVKVMFGEGQGFLWEKGVKGINRYTVWKDGVEAVYDRVGQNMDLPEVLAGQFAPVKLGPTQALLQVTSQFEAPFLLDLSGGAVADVLSDIGQLDEINHAMGAVNKDRRAAIATRKVREADVEALGAKLEAYATLDDHLARVQAVRLQGARVAELSQRFTLLARLLDEVGAISRAVRQIQAALLHRVPESSGVMEASEVLGKVSDFQAAWVSRSGDMARLERALKPALPELQAITARAESWRKVCSWQGVLGAREHAMERLAKVELVRVPAVPWKVTLESFRRVSGWLALLTGMKATFDKAAKLQKVTLPDVTQVTGLLRRAVEAARLATILSRLEEQIERDDAQLQACLVETRDVLAEFRALGVCPTCNQDISPEHVVACTGE
jgi:hypothetical protein